MHTTKYVKRNAHIYWKLQQWSHDHITSQPVALQQRSAINITDHSMCSLPVATIPPRDDRVASSQSYWNKIKCVIALAELAMPASYCKSCLYYYYYFHFTGTFYWRLLQIRLGPKSLPKNLCRLLLQDFLQASVSLPVAQPTVLKHGRDTTANGYRLCGRE